MKKSSFLDITKAYDTVPHQRLLKKLVYGIIGRTHNWISEWLTKQTQRVVINGSQSDYIPVISGVPQGSILGPLVFLLYIKLVKTSHHPYTYSQMTVLYTVQLVMMMILSHSRKILMKSPIGLICTWQMKFNVSK